MRSRKGRGVINFIGKIEFALRLMLAGVFIYAGVPKVMDPEGFARIIFGYDVFSPVLINLLAITVPFIELFSGAALLFESFKRPALFVINFLLFLFMIVIGYNLIRGHEFDCGCFSVGVPGHVSPALQLLVRDIALLSVGVYLLFLHTRKKEHSYG